MSTNLQNSIWPNEGGTLGQIKVQIPTGTANDPWPTGDALVNYFVFNKGKLVGFVDTKALIANSSRTTTFPYEYVNISLPSIDEGEMTYNYDQCAYVVLNGEVLKGNLNFEETKYSFCKNLEDIKAIDPNYLTNDIIDGVWSERLDDLEVGGNGSWNSGMFRRCNNLTSFNSPLPKLINGVGMFYGCLNLSSFNINLSKLIKGAMMFGNCIKLTSFNSNLSSLINGADMFYNCSLDTPSVQNIADTINVYNGEIAIDIANATPNDQEIAAFNTIASKGWTVYVKGSEYTPTSPAAITTLDENGEETVTPIPFWAKPVQSDEEHAKYIDSEGNFFIIRGGQFIYGDNLEEYGMFTCEEDAAANMRLTKIEKS